MTCQTDGIHSTAPVRWRSFDGMCAVHWEARGEAGARGYYRSPDPRIMLFFNEVSHCIAMSEQKAAASPGWRPMLRALFVPSGIPIWTQFKARHEFSHLDLHLRRDWLLERLTPMMGEATAEEALRQPVELQDVGALATIATTLASEIGAPSRGPRFAESLAIALITGLIDPPQQAHLQPSAQGGLTPSQMHRLRKLIGEQKRRMTNLELSQAVGLSEGWFCHAFKKTTGKTPLQWQQELRISMVKESLLMDDLTIAEIALRHDFSDQGHLTRVFRRCEGTTPSAWRRAAKTRG
ncbi:AraC family transcriptional regulator [Oceanicola sp. D3]|uniref:helix-turn-helix domain-containing protein n=1 Tax=Oceanicola sp. D3 TaxID=2587163 RepID=UPI0020C79023|nr:AraC family transcriptional regulator [Oceanicola sp. D3]